MPESDRPAHTDTLADALAEAAYAAFDDGDLLAARSGFEAVLAAEPDDPVHHYMLGLVCKYLRDWDQSLRHNLRSLALRAAARGIDDGKEHGTDDQTDDEASRWNAAIAATALGDWAEARRQWAACGIDIPAGDGAIHGNFGVLSLRLDPWDRGETLFARRIDPVRAQIINVPLPDSGYRYGDIVLHDGAATGERRFHQSRVPVMNALQRTIVSEYPTFAVFATCPRREDLDALVAMRVPGIAFIEDWTESIRHVCLRCSYGAPHRHREDDDANDAAAWRPERNLGVAAQSRRSVLRLIERWKEQGAGRRLDALESRDHEPSAPPGQGVQWWLAPEDRADAGSAIPDDAIDETRDEDRDDELR
ncbi:hypothetical protein [Lysobacter hankyongensis]|uniref:Tetratricopeptide repeat protein n=1 Tax=Lysobacter hankyongensis TaxID=1176535 RepID=A0ABP9BZQ8_9GAMM